MDDGARISRRRLLVGGLGVVAAGTLPSAVRPFVRPDPGEDPLAGRLRGLVDGPGVRELGRARLAELPAGVTGGAIARQVLPSRHTVDAALAASDAELVDAVVGVIEEDLRRGALLPVRGWLLSETEARLCVLTVLRR